MAQTQAEVDELIDGIIIDNNTMQVNPAKVRAVLKAINARVPGPSDPSSASFTTPLAYDAFTNTVSISQASTAADGYLTKQMFARIKVVPFGQMEIFNGPEKEADDVTLQVDDVAAFIYIADSKPVFFIGAYLGGDPTTIVDGLPANWTLIMSNPYK